MNSPLSSEAPPRVLIVEGQDDMHVVLNIWHRGHDSSLPFEIEVKNGDVRVLSSIRSEVQAPNRQVLGIMLDANGDVSGRWRTIRDRLRAAQINPPDAHDPAGTIIDEADRKPRVGIWIMPDNGLSGEIEDFVASMIPDGDPVWPLARNYIDSIPADAQKFARQKETRAIVYAWLAVRKEPRRMGQAISIGDLSVDGELCRRFTAWLDRLFA